MAFLTMYYAARAEVNVGLITTIWSVNPLFMAIGAFAFFAEKLETYHFVGMILIVICTVLLSLSTVISPKEEPIVID